MIDSEHLVAINEWASRQQDALLDWRREASGGYGQHCRVSRVGPIRHYKTETCVRNVVGGVERSQGEVEDTDIGGERCAIHHQGRLPIVSGLTNKTV